MNDCSNYGEDVSSDSTESNYGSYWGCEYGVAKNEGDCR